MSDGLRAILSNNRFDVTQKEFDEWLALTLELKAALQGLANFQRGREEWPEVKAADAVLAKFDRA